MNIFKWLKSSNQRSADNDVELDFDPDNPFPDPIEIVITDVFDLHTIQPREVKVVVEEYLQQAFEKGFKSVRIIHGKGVGVQREIVRSVLAATPLLLIDRRDRRRWAKRNDREV
jgi:hypothetical protein